MIISKMENWFTSYPISTHLAGFLGIIICGVYCYSLVADVWDMGEIMVAIAIIFDIGLCYGCGHIIHIMYEETKH